MKPCNNNSECIYFKENNTFYCKCQNGASECEDNNTNATIVSLKDIDPPRLSAINNVEKGMPMSDINSNKEANTLDFKFNTDNVKF